MRILLRHFSCHNLTRRTINADDIPIAEISAVAGLGPVERFPAFNCVEHCQEDTSGIGYGLCYELMIILLAQSERHIRLFRNGRNQALRIPRDFELEGDEAIIRKEGDRLIVEPIRKGRLLALLASLDPLDEPFPDVDEDRPPLGDVAL